MPDLDRTNLDPNPPRGCPTLMDLAAYLDGRADEALCERIDVHLAGCATCLGLVNELRASLQEADASHIFVPSEVITAAMNLVTHMNGDATVSIAPDGLARWLTVVRRSAAAAAAIGICMVGHHIGASMSGTMAASSQVASNSATSADDDLSFGLLDATTDPASGADLLQIALSTEATQ